MWLLLAIIIFVIIIIFTVFRIFIDLFLPVLGLCCCTRNSLVAASQGCSLVGVHRLLTVAL